MSRAGCVLVLALLAAVARGGYLQGTALRTSRVGSRSSLLRMAGASDRMASHGLLYDGWGAEGLKSLNESHQLLDQAYDQDVPVNRYDLTRIVANRAKEIAYAHCDDDEMMGLNPMLSGPGNPQRTPKDRTSEVMRAIKELQEDCDNGAQLTLPEDAGEPLDTELAEAILAEEEAAAASELAGSSPEEAQVNGPAPTAEEAAAQEEGSAVATAAKEPPAEDGFEALLADLSEVDMDEDEDFDDDLDDLEGVDMKALFGSISVATDQGGLESGGMHPGDRG